MVRRSRIYDTALASTREIVDKHDLIGLLEFGAPADEYSAQAFELVRMILSLEPVDEAAVNAVWTRSFGDDYSMSGTDVLAAFVNDLRLLQASLA